MNLSRATEALGDAVRARNPERVGRVLRLVTPSTRALVVRRARCGMSCCDWSCLAVILQWLPLIKDRIELATSVFSTALGTGAFEVVMHLLKWVGCAQERLHGSVFSQSEQVLLRKYAVARFPPCRAVQVMAALRPFLAQGGSLHVTHWAVGTWLYGIAELFTGTQSEWEAALLQAIEWMLEDGVQAKDVLTAVLQIARDMEMGSEMCSHFVACVTRAVHNCVAWSRTREVWVTAVVSRDDIQTWAPLGRGPHMTS